ncbi:lantibiotic dehydratase [Oenococcus oeni]|uniref:lantibiotic dehydratase n=1 Tax=Oenococcus oeni TaxID=1247 RepID=UPI00164897A9|nr:lantibiotic dehydratase [Oenococcus oeni]
MQEIIKEILQNKIKNLNKATVADLKNTNIIQDCLELLSKKKVPKITNNPQIKCEIYASGFSGSDKDFFRISPSIGTDGNSRFIDRFVPIIYSKQNIEKCFKKNEASENIDNQLVAELSAKFSSSSVENVIPRTRYRQQAVVIDRYDFKNNGWIRPENIDLYVDNSQVPHLLYKNKELIIVSSNMVYPKNGSILYQLLDYLSRTQTAVEVLNTIKNVILQLKEPIELKYGDLILFSPMKKAGDLFDNTVLHHLDYGDINRLLINNDLIRNRYAKIDQYGESLILNCSDKEQLQILKKELLSNPDLLLIQPTETEVKSFTDKTCDTVCDILVSLHQDSKTQYENKDIATIRQFNRKDNLPLINKQVVFLNYICLNI